jgi:hypothetical protein
MTEQLGDPTLVDARDIAAALSTDAERGLSSTRRAPLERVHD